MGTGWATKREGGYVIFPPTKTGEMENVVIILKGGKAQNVLA